LQGDDERSTTMAETSLGLDELVRKLMGDEHADVLRESLAWFVRELMEAEVASQIGADLHEKNAERTTRRNGYWAGSVMSRMQACCGVVRRLVGRMAAVGRLTEPAQLLAGHSGASNETRVG
jgi:transposase-like protein